MKKQYIVQIEKKHNFFESYVFTLTMVVLNLVVVGILLGFMMHTDNQNTKVTSYTQQIANLMIENQQMQDIIASNQNVVTIQQKASQMGMVMADNIVYLNNTNVISYHLPASH